MPISRVDQICKALKYGLFPPQCRVCGNAGHKEHELCPLCMVDLPARPAVKAFGAGQVLAAFAYGDPIDGLIQGFKFNEQLGAGRLLATLALPAFAQSKPQALIPIPLHCKRLRQRGFNQAMELARFWGSECGIAVQTQALIRQRQTAVQSSLNAIQRAENVRGAFEARGPMASHVALIDDVFTTGATCMAAAEALYAAGAHRVDVWCLARVL
jgi:ComF family protein